MTRRTRAQWEAAIQQWRASGLTAQEFAAREGLTASTLRWWSSRLRRVDCPSPFVEVRMVPAMGQPLAVVLRDGLRIEVPETFDSEVLRRLVAALDQH